MILEIKNISISLEQNQEKALIKHVEKLGIKKELIIPEFPFILKIELNNKNNDTTH